MADDAFSHGYGSAASVPFNSWSSLPSVVPGGSTPYQITGSLRSGRFSSDAAPPPGQQGFNNPLHLNCQPAAVAVTADQLGLENYQPAPNYQASILCSYAGVQNHLGLASRIGTGSAMGSALVLYSSSGNVVVVE